MFVSPPSPRILVKCVELASVFIVKIRGSTSIRRLLENSNNSGWGASEARYLETACIPDNETCTLHAEFYIRRDSLRTPNGWQTTRSGSVSKSVYVTFMEAEAGVSSLSRESKGKLPAYCRAAREELSAIMLSGVKI